MVLILIINQDDVINKKINFIRDSEISINNFD